MKTGDTKIYNILYNENFIPKNEDIYPVIFHLHEQEELKYKYFITREYNKIIGNLFINVSIPCNCLKSDVIYCEEIVKGKEPRIVGERVRFDDWKKNDKHSVEYTFKIPNVQIGASYKIVPEFTEDVIKRIDKSN